MTGARPKLDPYEAFQEALLARRVTRRVMARDRDAEEAARDMFFKGLPPDGDPWRGGPLIDEIRTSFTSVEASKPRFRGDRGRVTIESGEEGISLNSFLLKRFLKAYPGGERVLEKVFEEALVDKAPKLRRHIKDLIEDPRQAWKVGQWIFGYREADEWETPSDVKVRRVKIGRRGHYSFRGIYGTWEADIEFRSKRKPPVGEGPFTGMSDRELNQWIERWESFAPENFWMDGELHLSRPAAYKMYRDRWRKMPPREQISLMDDIQRYY